MADTQKCPKTVQKGFKRGLVPKLPWEPRDTDPLVNLIYVGLKRVEERCPRQKNEIKPIHKPRTVLKDHITILRISKANQ